MDEREVWLTYAAVPGIGRRRMLALMCYFPSATSAWEAPLAVLAGVPGLNVGLAAALVAARRQPRGGAVLERLAALGGEMVLHGSAAYPPLLCNIHDRPPYFFRLGPAPLDAPAVAVVGSRKATSYGLANAYRIAAELAQAGITVISGLALGIDGDAHRGALSVGGNTVAVLGCGPDIAYPPEHRRLYQEIAERGAIVSELPPGTRPDRYLFPERNRLISGLSFGVVVVEAGDRSGALITARLAVEQGREVLAVPGPVQSIMSRGPHGLIQQGAALVHTAQEVLAALRPGAPAGPGAGALPAASGRAAQGRTRAGSDPELPARVKGRAGEADWTPAPGTPLTPDESALYTWLGEQIRSADDLAAATGLPAPRVAAALTLLELRGLIRALPDGLVVRT